jgi:hypothetical protein
VKLDPHTRVGSLLVAIPSSALVFDRLGITAAGNEDKSLQKVCAARGVGMEDFLRAMDEIDWDKESPPDKEQTRS